MADINTIVIDNGSGAIKAGFGGDDIPRCILQTVGSKASTDGVWSFQEIDQKNERWIKKSPIHRGKIRDWDLMEEMWRYVFHDKLGKNTLNDTCVFITEAKETPVSQSERIAQIMFEKFKVKGLSFGRPGILGLYGSGRTTGLVLDVGEGVTSVSPAYEGYLVDDGDERSDLAGMDLTAYLKTMIRGLANSAEELSLQALQEMKEKTCFVLCDSTSSTESQVKYELPDGSELVLGDERFQCGEALFNPLLLGSKSKSVQDMIKDSIIKCAIDIRKDLYSNVVVVGGSTMLQGFADRLSKELNLLAPNNAEVKVIALSDRKFSVWIGGSILTSLSTFQGSWVTRETYNDIGPHTIRSCFNFKPQ